MMVSRRLLSDLIFMKEALLSKVPRIPYKRNSRLSSTAPYPDLVLILGRCFRAFVYISQAYAASKLEAPLLVRTSPPSGIVHPWVGQNLLNFIQSERFSERRRLTRSQPTLVSCLMTCTALARVS